FPHSCLFLLPISRCSSYFFFCFSLPPTTDISTLSLHDALPICHRWRDRSRHDGAAPGPTAAALPARAGAFPGGLHHHPHVVPEPDRKSTRLNSSHGSISYAVFCLKKKKNQMNASVALTPIICS